MIHEGRPEDVEGGAAYTEGHVKVVHGFLRGVMFFTPEMFKVKQLCKLFKFFSLSLSFFFFLEIEEVRRSN